MRLHIPGNEDERGNQAALPQKHEEAVFIPGHLQVEAALPGRVVFVDFVPNFGPTVIVAFST